MRHGRRHRHARRAVAALLTTALVVATSVLTDPAPVEAEASGAHAPPVDVPVVDPFRAPLGPYGAGNRGLEYATVPGTEVRASAPGEVTFAGQVGGSLHVVVLHDTGLRTSYSFLAGTVVRRGQAVAQGEVVGTSGPSLHFGARAGERYLDPALLFDGGAIEVRLVPVAGRSPRPVVAERRALLAQLVSTGAVVGAVGTARWLAGAGVDAAAGGLAAATDLGRVAIGSARGGAAAVAAGAGTGRAVLRAAAARARRRLVAPLLTARALTAASASLRELRADQRGCTPADVHPPPPPPGRRIVVLVAGYGSTGGDAEVLDLDTTALGYAPADRVQLSYAGGRVPGVGSLAGVEVRPYGPADSMVDLRSSGSRLRRLLADIGTAHPGVPVDLIAHSQGGLVAREALSRRVGGEPLPVGHVITLGTPHGGAPGASLALELGLDGDSTLGAGLAGVTGGGVDPRATSVAQMAEGSAYLGRLARRPLPSSVVLTSIAAAGDVVVPATSSVAPGARNALVGLVGPTAHGRLPGSVEAAREVALALGGAGPTCATVAAHVAGVATAAAVAAVEHGVGGVAAPTVLVADGLAGVLLALVGAG